MKNIPALLTILAALAVGLLIFTELNDKPNEVDIRIEERNKVRNEFQPKLDSLALEYEITKRQRDSAAAVADSARLRAERIAAESIKKDREIAALRGKYNNTPQDSLGAIMDRRAAANVNK